MDINLTEEQKADVRNWVKGGMSLSDIQKKLTEEFGISATYMSVRFLVIDLGVDIVESETPEEKKPEEMQQAAAGGLVNEDGDPVMNDGGGGVSVELDRVVKPGAIVSGTVVFSDGQNAAWSLDQLGRLALSASDPDYQPTEDDIAAFQIEIRAALEKSGF